jgi:hypothetical protein
MGYGLGYLIVQYRIRNSKPSFLQSQLFALCVYLGMFAAFAACSLVFRVGVFSSASTATVTVVLVPLKLIVGGAVGAHLYPFMSHKRLGSRYVSPTPIPPKYASPPSGENGGTAVPPVADTSATRRRAAGRGSSRTRTRRR